MIYVFLGETFFKKKSSFMNRKDDHLKICLTENVEAKKVSTGFENYNFEYDALPELDFASISLKTFFLNTELEAPFMIGAMTGGTKKAADYNKKLAKVAEELGIAFALGSQRPMLKSEDFESFDVKKHAPNLRVLMGNLGAIQLNYGVQLEDVQNLIEKVGCDGFTFHLNPLQEAIQPEGDRNFKGILEKLRQMIPQISVPVSIKEVGAGISKTTALKIKTLPVTCVEVAGVGGTSWAYIEALRNKNNIAKITGTHLRGFGVPTAKSIQICSEILPEKIIIGSGGIRTALDIAKALALGANMVAFALPALKAVDSSYEEILFFIRQMIHELKTILFITGSTSIGDLGNKIFFQESKRS